MNKKPFKICSIYDTETCNYGNDENTESFCILYIVNDLKYISIKDYIIDKSDNIYYYRFKEDYINYLKNLIQFGIDNNLIPIVAAYNLMFDLQTILYDLAQKYKISLNAQSSTNAYTLDLLDENENILLRFWDTFHLELNGLEAMGNTCGVAKATGNWDYNKIRTPYTQLTDEELFYAKRDVQVIPAYLNYLLKANSFITEDMFGLKIITKTSIVRQMAYSNIGSIHIKTSKKRLSLLKLFEWQCRNELPKAYQQYAIRKACFRGGLTFTSANLAMQIQENVASLDVTSMHHAFICGKYVPQKFIVITYKKLLNKLFETIVNTSREEILNRYHKPFLIAGHFKIKFNNIRLKKNSAFEKWGIAILSQAKFMYKSCYGEYGENELVQRAEEEVKNNNFIDEAYNYNFAFGKLMSADYVILHLNELELWCVSQVYDYDSYNVIYAEATRKFAIPSDYVTLQSSILFNTKNDLKQIVKKYKEGTPYIVDIPETIPQNIANMLKNGTISDEFLNAYYNSTIKGMFNGIYGTQAQDIFKPKYIINNQAEISVDENSICSPSNFDVSDKTHNKVLYTYGMRIVGGSRLHLIIAIQLLYEKLDSKIDILGGDTDSLKIRCDKDITSDDLLNVLKPLHNAVTKAIDITMYRARHQHKKYASNLDNVGCFECENENDFYIKHMEAWNKGRISLTKDNKVHITCAGLPQPKKLYNTQDFTQDLLKKYKFEYLAPLILGFNVFISPQICHYLQKIKPKYNERFKGYVTDYLGNKKYIDVPKAISLYSCGRYIGQESKITNSDCIDWLQTKNVKICTKERVLELIDNKPQITIFDNNTIQEVN